MTTREQTTSEAHLATASELARNRTALAYDRTFFALIRTSISLMGIGVAIARAVDTVDRRNRS